MMRRIALACVWGLVVGLGNGLAQVPEIAPSSPAESLLRQPPVVALQEPAEQPGRHSGLFGSAGVLVAPPLLYDVVEHSHEGTFALPPIPSPTWTFGYRRANDVSWQASGMIVPLHMPRDFSTTFTWGADLDRLSTNRSRWEETDVRWQVGLRCVGIAFNGSVAPFALGPHAGLRFERPLSERMTGYGWADVGVLPTVFSGIPVVDLRGELGLSWRPAVAPGLSFSAALFNEHVGFVVTGFMTPGIKVGLGWNF